MLSLHFIRDIFFYFDFKLIFHEWARGGAIELKTFPSYTSHTLNMYNAMVWLYFCDVNCKAGSNELQFK